MISLFAVLALAGCSLPYMTPPASSVATIAPTITVPGAPTAVPATATPALHAVTITAANAASLTAANKAPANNVQVLDWSSDSTTLGLVSQNTDANGNATFSATLLDGANLNVKTVWAAPDGARITQIGPDGRLAAVITSDMKTVSLYDLGDGNKDVVEITPQYLISGATFSPDGKYFSITDMDDMAVSLHNLPDGSEAKVLSGFTTAAPVFDAGFAGNSALLAWHARATIQLQDIASGKMGKSFEHEDFVSTFQLSHDGKILASAALKTVDGDVKPAVTLWDTTSGAVLHILVISSTSSGLSFSPDDSLLAVSVDNTIQIWDVAGGTLLATLTGHSNNATLVAFAPDGKSLASTGQDNQLILWQVLK
jgi:WD40 repeat protein